MRARYTQRRPASTAGLDFILVPAANIAGAPGTGGRGQWLELPLEAAQLDTAVLATPHTRSGNDAMSATVHDSTCIWSEGHVVAPYEASWQ
jgi:hypothetical protein